MEKERRRNKIYLKHIQREGYERRRYNETGREAGIARISRGEKQK